MRNINHILRKNRSILEGLYSQGYKTISSEKLVLLGFQFQYCTFIQQEKSLRVYYDFALNKQTNDTFKILCVASDDLLQTG